MHEFGSVGVIQSKLKAGAKPDIVIVSTAAAAAAEKDGSALAGSVTVPNFTAMLESKSPPSSPPPVAGGLTKAPAAPTGERR